VIGGQLNPITSKRPSWRKTKQEVIDEKVERLFETYKLMDEVNKNKQALYGGMQQLNANKKNTLKNKYFPDEDEDDEEEE
jgi:ABC-type Fe3+/spermidine/putrescine transport system ATPase subunit